MTILMDKMTLLMDKMTLLPGGMTLLIDRMAWADDPDDLFAGRMAQLPGRRSLLRHAGMALRYLWAG